MSHRALLLYLSLATSLTAYVILAIVGNTNATPGSTVEAVVGLALGSVALALYAAAFVQAASRLVRRQRRLVSRAANLEIALLLFVLYPFAVSLIAYGLYEASPVAFQNLGGISTPLERLARFWALASLVQNGTGFTLIQPDVWYSELLFSLIGKFYALVDLLVVSIVLSDVLGR